MDLQTAEKATRNGATAGFFLAAVTLVVVVFALAGFAPAPLAQFADPWSLLDACLIGGLAFGIRRRSRVAAVVLLIYFIASRISASMQLGRVTGLGVTLVFLYYFGRASEGTFAYHRIRRKRDPDYRPEVKWMYFVWPPVVILASILVLFVLASTFRLTPPMTVIPGEELRPREIALLVSEGLLGHDEKVVLFYSTGLISIRDGGSILTEEGVVSYVEVEGELVVQAVPYSGIADIVVERKGDFLNDTIIAITTEDGRKFGLLAPPAEEGDSKILEEIRQRWHRLRK